MATGRGDTRSPRQFRSPCSSGTVSLCPMFSIGTPASLKSRVGLNAAMKRRSLIAKLQISNDRYGGRMMFRLRPRRHIPHCHIPFFDVLCSPLVRKICPIDCVLQREHANRCVSGDTEPLSNNGENAVLSARPRSHPVPDSGPCASSKIRFAKLSMPLTPLQDILLGR